MTTISSQLAHYSKQKLRLIIMVGEIAETSELSKQATTVLKFAQPDDLSLEKTGYCRADCLVVGNLKATNKKAAEQLVEYIHEAGCIIIAESNPVLEKQLLAMVLKRIPKTSLFVRAQGYTPEEYGVSYIERWGTTDFMKNWKLEGDNILAHLPVSFTRKNLRVLDVGCLNGYIMEALRRHGVKNVFGTDISYEIAINRCVDRYHLPAITITDFVDNNYPDGFSDMTICMEVLEHITPAHTDRFISELARVTSEKGVVLISTSEDWDADATHVNCRKRYEWYALFAKHGLLPYGPQIIFSGFNSFVFHKAGNIGQAMWYKILYNIGAVIPFWGPYQRIKNLLTKSA